MRYIVGAIFLSLAFLASPAKAQDALVVQTCGTLPLAYAPGATRLVTVDTTGKLCSSAGGGGGVTVGAAVTGGSSGCNLFVTSTSTVGCVAAVSETDTGSVLALTGNLNLPDTTGAAVGVINFGAARMIHDFGATTNIFVGKNAGNFTLTGTQNACFGSSTCNVLAAGSTNAVFGESAGLALAGASNNTLLGRFAGGANVAGTQMTAVGSGALQSATGGTNVGMGFTAGADIVGGTGNIVLGTNTGRGIITGTDNVVIGRNITGLAAGLASAIVLGSGAGVIQADFASTTAATWTFNGALAASLNTATGTNVVCNTPGTKTALTVQVFATGCVASSARFKEGIASIDKEQALADVLAFQPVSYFYKPEFNMGADRHVGFTAEQVGSVDPQWITYEDDGVTPHAVKYNEMAPLLAAAIQALKADNDNLRAEIEDLKRRVR